LNRLTQVLDSLNGTTGFAYDANGNLLSVTDARSNATTYTYDNMDRLATRVDPLTRSESCRYDLAGNMTQFTDRKSQATAYTYDALNRRTGVTYADASTTTYTYDAGNRLTQVVDSIAGTITRTYDGLDRLMSETTPQGSVSYALPGSDPSQTVEKLSVHPSTKLRANGRLLKPLIIFRSCSFWPSVGGRGGMQLVVAEICVIIK